LQPGWTWENENPERWTITEDGWLQILAEDSALLQDFSQSNLLWRGLPPGDFAVTVHVQSIPLVDFHQTAIFIYEDGANYITINRGYCSLPHCVGTGVYMDYKIGGEWGGYKQHTEATDLYLRLESAGQMISGYYSLDGSDWQRVGRFGNYFTFTRVGIGASNVDSPRPTTPTSWAGSTSSRSRGPEGRAGDKGKARHQQGRVRLRRFSHGWALGRRGTTRLFGQGLPSHEPPVGLVVQPPMQATQAAQ
jgi:hypothetical protein